VGHLRDSDLVARKLGDIQMIVCAAPSYLERRGTPQAPADLTAHDCLAFSDAPGISEWRFRKEAGSDGKVAISPRLWVNGLDALVLAARDGSGIVRVPSWQVTDELATGRLRRILQSYEPPPAPLHLLSQPSRLASAKTRAFADYLIAEWQRDDPFAARG